MLSNENKYVSLSKQNEKIMESSKWQDANEIYNINPKARDMSKKIYRQSDGFEAFVIGEETAEIANDCWLIEGNGVRCKVWKKTTKNKIINVPNDYELRKLI